MKNQMTNHPLDGRIHQKYRGFYWLMCAVLAIYFSYIVFLRNLLHDRYIGSEIGMSNVFLASTAVFSIVAFFIMLLWISKKAPVIPVNTERSKLDWKTFLLIFLFCAAFHSLIWAARYPGGITGDNWEQWKQVQAFSFYDWHPAAHSLLIWLLTRITNHYSFVLLVQVFVFSAGMAYLGTTMIAWGYHSALVIPMIALICVGKQTQDVLTYPWKDTAFSLFLIFTLVHILNIYHSKGKWLERLPNAVVFAVVLGFATLMRHNGVLLTLPLMLLVMIQYRRYGKQVVLAALTAMLMVFLVKVPLYNGFGVKRQHRTYEETVGVPMTVLYNAYAFRTNLMPRDAYMFMRQIATPIDFRKNTNFGDYSTAKYAFGIPKYVRTVSPAELMKMTFHTVREIPLFSLLAVSELTDMVWDPFGELEGVIPANYRDRNPDTSLTNVQIKANSADILDLLNNVFASDIITELSSKLGLLIALLLIAWLTAFRRIGFASFLLVCPMMIYNLGTMLMLISNEYRYFHFNCILAYPCILMLLSVERKEEKLIPSEK